MTLSVARFDKSTLLATRQKLLPNLKINRMNDLCGSNGLPRILMRPWVDSYRHYATQWVSIRERRTGRTEVLQKNKRSNGLLRCSWARTLPEVLRRSRLTAGLYMPHKQPRRQTLRSQLR